MLRAMSIVVALAALFPVASCAGPERPADQAALAAYLGYRRAWLEGDLDAVRARTTGAARPGPNDPEFVESARIMALVLEPLGPLSVRVEGDQAELEVGGRWPSRWLLLREDGVFRVADGGGRYDLGFETAGHEIPVSVVALEYRADSPVPELTLVLLSDGDPALSGRRVTDAEIRDRIAELTAERGAPPAVRLHAHRDLPWRTVAARLRALAAAGVRRLDFATRYPGESTRFRQGTVPSSFPPGPLAPDGVHLFVEVHGTERDAPDLSRLPELLRKAPEELTRRPLILELSPALPLQVVVTAIEEIRDAGIRDIALLAPDPAPAGAAPDPPAAETKADPPLSVTAAPLDAETSARLITATAP